MRIDIKNYEEYVIDFLEGSLSEEIKIEFEKFLKDNPMIQDEISGLSSATLTPEKVSSGLKEELYQTGLPKDEVIENLLIGKLEGDLSAEEEIRVDKWIKEHKDIGKTWSLFSVSKILPGSYVYNRKRETKVPSKIQYSNIDELFIGKIEGDLNRDQQAELSNKMKSEPSLMRDLSLFESVYLKDDQTIHYKDKESLKRTVVINFSNRILYAVAGIAAVLAIFFMIPQDENTGLAMKNMEQKAIHNRTTIKINMAGENEAISFQDKAENNSGTSSIIDPIQNIAQSGPNKIENEWYGKEMQATKSIGMETAVLSKKINPILIEGYYELSPIVSTPEDFDQMAEVPTTKINNYPDVKSFVKDKAKEALWGDEEYPEEDYSLALANKMADKISEKSDINLDLASHSESDNNWSFQVGKLKVERIKN